MRVGDIYLCDVGSQQIADQIQKTRPVILVKCERRSTLVHVVPLTGNSGKPLNDRHIQVEGHGLDRPSIALIEQVCLIDKTSLGGYVGSIRKSWELDRILSCLAHYFYPDAA